jgi:hypothetical protein
LDDIQSSPIILEARIPLFQDVPIWIFGRAFCDNIFVDSLLGPLYDWSVDAYSWHI